MSAQSPETAGGSRHLLPPAPWPVPEVTPLTDGTGHPADTVRKARNKLAAGKRLRTAVRRQRGHWGGSR